MLFLYRPGTFGSKKLLADGVIGKLHSIEHYDDNPHLDRKEYIGSDIVIVKLEISNNGMIELACQKYAFVGLEKIVVLLGFSDTATVGWCGGCPPYLCYLFVLFWSGFNP